MKIVNIRKIIIADNLSVVDIIDFEEFKKIHMESFYKQNSNTIFKTNLYLYGFHDHKPIVFKHKIYKKGGKVKWNY